MKRREFLKTTAAAAGASVLPLEALAQSDRRKELLIVANETGPNSLDIHTVGANRPSYGVSWLVLRPADDLRQEDAAGRRASRTTTPSSSPSSPRAGRSPRTACR